MPSTSKPISVRIFETSSILKSIFKNSDNQLNDIFINNNIRASKIQLRIFKLNNYLTYMFP